MACSRLNLDDAETPEHKTFLESLLTSNQVELLCTDFEKLKDELAKRMRVSEAPPAKVVRGNRDSPIVHIWHSMDNVTSLHPLKQYLCEHDCAIQVFNYTSTPTEKMQSRLPYATALLFRIRYKIAHELKT